jgi:methanogenic corrinoid protein MtbC1
VTLNTQRLAETERAFRQKDMGLDVSRDILAGVLEAEIIPRLLMVHRTHPAKPPNLFKPSQADISAFADMLLSSDTLAVAAYIEALRSKGLSIESIYLGLITGTARHLGELWGNDTCNFCEVTLAVWPMQQLLHELSPIFQCEPGVRQFNGRRVLLCPIAAEQHTLGVAMVAEFFRRGGWDVIGDIPSNNDELVEAVAKEHLDLIGLSVSGEVDGEQLAALIAAIRHASRNPMIGIMVGGWGFLERPELSVVVGADFMARDAREAVVRADQHMEFISTRSSKAHWR